MLNYWKIDKYGLVNPVGRWTGFYFSEEVKGEIRLWNWDNWRILQKYTLQKLTQSALKKTSEGNVRFIYNTQWIVPVFLQKELRQCDRYN